MVTVTRMATARILIIDDREEVRDAFSRALALDGYETRTAENAESAMQAVEAMDPDAILLDLMMPRVNGLRFLYRLRETHRRTPVAVITGKSDVNDRTVREIHNLDADIRFKPISIAQIHAVVRRLLTRPPRSEGAEPHPDTDDERERSKQAVDRSRKAADDVRAAAERARAERARKKR
jgi:two-component system response regulator MprA